MLRSIVAGDGGDPDKVRDVTIGFQAVPALLARPGGRRDRFWNVEGVALRAKRPDTTRSSASTTSAPRSTPSSCS